MGARPSMRTHRSTSERRLPVVKLRISAKGSNGQEKRGRSRTSPRRPTGSDPHARGRVPSPTRSCFVARAWCALRISQEAIAMPMPTDIGVIDLMIAPPFHEAKRTYQFLRQNLRDRESLEDFEFPAQYMFKDVPHPEPGGDPVAFLVEQMDRFGIEKGMLGVGFDERAADSVRALKEHPDRFFGSFEVNPNRGMDGVRELVRAVEELGVKAATAF